MAVGKFGGPLYRKLADYGASDFYAFHMPGHKRLVGEFENPFHMDITEIDGFDDLHHPEAEGILTEAQRRAARIFGAEETHFLVNGSTAGILSAISGCTGQGGTLLMARNCHRSAYHGAELRGLKTEYLYPQYLEELGINGAVLPEDVEKALNEKKEIQAVMIVSPTYDGVCSDVERIAAVCHSFGVPLIVDQAHGAHFRFSEYFPEDAVSAGADVVIHSVHKTLPSLTQTALLHVQGKLVNRERIRKFLSIYQSSSPSYVLMASIDACVELIEREGRELFEKHVRKLQAFRESCRDLKMLYLAGSDREPDFDRSKLLISARRANRAGAGLTGEELSRILRERYHIQMEMSGPDYVVGIASVGDSKEGFRRLAEALHEIDRELDRTDPTEGTDRKARNESAKSSALPRLEAVLTIGEAGEAEGTCRPLAACEGAVSGTYVYLYPPGIPVLAPGERVTAELLKGVEAWLTAGYEVHGLEADSEGTPALKIVVTVT